MDNKKQKPQNIASELSGVAATYCELFSDDDDVCYATVQCADHSETYPLRSSRMRDYLGRLFFREMGMTPTRSTIDDVLGQLSGIGRYDGPTQNVHRRIAEHDGEVFLDLANHDWAVVRITAEGWGIIPEKACPIRFIRPKAMLPLCEPSLDGNLAMLPGFINCRSTDWPLVAGWLIGCLNPREGYPALVLNGEQGTGKSVAAELLRSLIDPNSAPLRSLPRKELDLMISAKNQWVLSWDNISSISHNISDALCRIATGGGQACRQLYTDDDESIIRVSRPQIINGIGDLLHNSDLIDRSIFVELERIRDHQRKPLDEIRRDFETFKPQILGGLLDAASEALAKYDSVKSNQWPRMANFAKWVTAAEGKLHLPDGQTFLAAYNYNRQGAHQLAIEGSEFAITLIDVCRDDGGFNATAGDVLDKVNAKASEAAIRSKYWPTTPKACSNQIRRLSPNLAANGIEVEYLPRKNNKRLIRFTVTTVTPSLESDASDEGDCHPLIPFGETA